MKRTSLALAIGLAAAFFASGAFDPAYAQVPPVPHYECWNVPGVPLQIQPVDLETQFGTSTGVEVGPPTRLCLPALKNGEGSLTEPHVECFAITGDPVGKSVNLITQFGMQRKVTVGSPTDVCVPAGKAIVPASPAEPPLVPHYECFNISGGTQMSLPPVVLETQFGEEPAPVPVLNPTRLCLPALKNGEGDLNLPHVECFAIAAIVRPVPTVNLLTQFGPQSAVEPIIPAAELCVPALKQERPPPAIVGGIAEAPDDASSLEATASGGSDNTTYAVIAAAAAAGLALAGGGVWYARRRIGTS